MMCKYDLLLCVYCWLICLGVKLPGIHSIFGFSQINSEHPGHILAKIGPQIREEYHMASHILYTVIHKKYT